MKNSSFPEGFMKMMKDKKKNKIRQIPIEEKVIEKSAMMQK